MSVNCKHDPGWIPREDYELEHPRYVWACTRCGTLLMVEQGAVLKVPIPGQELPADIEWVSVSWVE